MSMSTKLTRRCNLGCSYCYQSTARVVKNASAAHDYDIDAILKTLVTRWDWEDKNNGYATPAVIHGGEPLLAKKEDLKKLFKIHYERFGRCSIQTNGVLIDDDHIDMFKAYNVSCGVSVDGWGHLNISRQQSGDVAATHKSTRKTLANMKRLVDEGMTPGLIVVLSRANATDEILPMDGVDPDWLGYSEEPITRRDALFKFLEYTVEELGMGPGRLNPAHVDVPWVQPIIQLTNEQLTDFWHALIPWAWNNGYKFKQIEEVRDVLFGLGQQTCTKTNCDPLHTVAEMPVQSDGEMGNCEHVYGTDGVPYQQADGGPKNHRSQVLVGTDWKHGGCHGGPDGKSDTTCKWWAACSGQCPGQAIDGDWRNRTRFCESWAALYQAVYDQTKNMFPNLHLLPDVASNYDPHQLYQAVHNCAPPWNPHAAADRTVTQRPSYWKKEYKNSLQNGVVLQDAVLMKAQHSTKKPHSLPTPTEGGWSHGDHQDNALLGKGGVDQNVEHGDVEHGDHQDHGDSG